MNDTHLETTFFDGLIKRITDPNYLAIYTITFILLCIFSLSYLYGIYTSWYNNLIFPTLNPWIPRILWIIAVIVSYIGIYVLWEESLPNEIPRDLGVSVLFIIGSFISLAWSISYLQLQDLRLAFWTSLILLAYETWLTIYIWFINKLSGLLLIPILVMYVYLVFSMAEISDLNGVSLI